MKNKGFVERNEKRISIALLLVVIAVWSAVLLSESPSFDYSGNNDFGQGYTAGYEPPNTSVPMEGCHIEYGASRCIDSKLVSSFYNPGTESVRRVSMYFYEGEDVDIYNCREPLPPGETGTLTTVPCSGSKDMSDIKLEWCCGGSCNSTVMSTPSDDLSIISA